MDFAEATKLALEIQAGAKQAAVAAGKLSAALPDDDDDLTQDLTELARSEDDLNGIEGLAGEVLKRLSDPDEGCEDAGEDEGCPECGRHD